MLMLFGVGCGPKSADQRVHVRSGLSGDSLGNNIVTKPIRGIFEWMTGAGIVIDEAVMKRKKGSGLLALFLTGNNTYSKTKIFWLKVGLP